jgi:hypothetical protein
VQKCDRFGEKRNRPAYRVIVGMDEEGYHSKDPGLRGEIILKLILNKYFIVNVK